ncbi:hypothetical protein PBRA_006972 [Plasmodiophora brassicae]|uniref:BZIP domain-containing protein n=1 Tax=Plasmodiophora brassicae TaxID=37360 RepID=A0A0G4IU29_PLABS|nr:hypothetical protein PBRA_006972 [Plasmodiophora brassicae]
MTMTKAMAPPDASLFDEVVLLNDDVDPFDTSVMMTISPNGSSSWNSDDSVQSPAPPATVVPLKDLIQDHAVKVQRLSRKAKLARDNRKRKSSRLNELEAECTALRAEVERLRGRERETLRLLREGGGNCSVHDYIVRQHLQDLVTAQQPMHGFNETLLDLTAVYDENGMMRLEAIKRAAMDRSSPPERFLAWAMSRLNPSFFTDENGMWVSLFQRRLGLSDVQLQRLRDHACPLAQAQSRVKSEIEAEFDALRQRWEAYGHDARRLLGAVLSTMTDDQFVKLVEWVGNNEICVNQLIQELP